MDILIGMIFIDYLVKSKHLKLKAKCLSLTYWLINILYQIYNYRVDICRDSAKIVTFIDLAGHEKYLKTTIFGMTGHAPDYTMLMIGKARLIDISLCT